VYGSQEEKEQTVAALRFSSGSSTVAAGPCCCLCTAAASFKRDSRLLNNILFRVFLFFFPVYVFVCLCAGESIEQIQKRRRCCPPVVHPTPAAAHCYPTIVRVAFYPVLSLSSSTRFTTRNVCINMWMMEEKSRIYFSAALAAAVDISSCGRGRNKLPTEFKVCWVRYGRGESGWEIYLTD